MKTKTVKQVLSLFIALAISAVCGVSAMAADTTATGTGTVSGNITVNGSIRPLTISVTHPLSVDYYIDPNGGPTGAFGAPDISIKNNTKVPVNVTVSSLKATTDCLFTDVDVADKTWASLNAADSKRYIALGIKAKDSTGWTAGYNTTTHYAVKDTATLIGALATNTTGTLTLTASYGLAFDTVVTAKHNLVLLFTLV